MYTSQDYTNHVFKAFKIFNNTQIHLRHPFKHDGMQTGMLRWYQLR